MTPSVDLSSGTPPADAVAASVATEKPHLVNAELRRSQGELAAAISNAVVRALAQTTGRGPTKARTTLGDNGVFVVLQDNLTRGERTLVNAGEEGVVLDLRRRWQRVMQVTMSRQIEELTGRKVIGFMSDHHIDPDLAVEVFVLQPLPEQDLHITDGEESAAAASGRR